MIFKNRHWMIYYQFNHNLYDHIYFMGSNHSLYVVITAQGGCWKIRSIFIKLNDIIEDYTCTFITSNK